MIYCNLHTVDIDECLNQSCHLNATCNNTVGSFICTCDVGYSGDGLNCSGLVNIYILIEVLQPSIPIKKKLWKKKMKQSIVLTLMQCFDNRMPRFHACTNALFKI